MMTGKKPIRTFFLIASTFFLILVLAIYAPGSVYSIECQPGLNLKDKTEDELREIEEACKDKVNQLSKKAASLSEEISLMDTQIYLTNLRIKNTEFAIKRIEKEIESLTDKIDGLDASLNYLSQILIQQIVENYKQRPGSMMVLLFDSQTAREFLSRFKYIKETQRYNQQLLFQVQDTKINFEEQKELREEKKQELANLKQVLNDQKINLNSQKAAKQRLLQVTRNDERIYQKLVREARRQLESFKAFVKTAGGGVISANGFGTGKLGWYYSQRDARWANKGVGLSNMSVFEVGCLVTDIAMIYKKYGYDITPATIASQADRFFSNTALMLIPWRGPGNRRYTEISKPQIDKELEEGNPVIVGLYAGKYGTHFVILVEKKGDDYVIYDPYYGPDMMLSSRYSFSSIYKAVVFK